jgi:hypothetical protein
MVANIELFGSVFYEVSMQLLAEIFSRNQANNFYDLPKNLPGEPIELNILMMFGSNMAPRETTPVIFVNACFSTKLKKTTIIRTIKSTKNL